MNRFLAVLRRPGAETARPVVDRLVEELNGPWCVVERSQACFAFEGAPPAGGELMFSGRLDNRSELAEALGDHLEAPGESEERTDAQLALAAYRAWGTDGFARLLGPFAMVLFEPREHRLLAVRDAVGDRALYTFRDDRWAVVANDLPLMLRHPAVPRDVDETSLAHFFAVEAPPPGRTYYAAVCEVPPGHFVHLAPDREEATRYWPREPLDPIRYRRDEEYVEHFRYLLAESVRCRLPAGEPVAVLMSGGLDSTSVAAMAAAERAGATQSGVHSISWVFDELSRADERRFIEPVVERHGLHRHYVVGDDQWPLCDLESWPVPAAAPWQSPYRRLQNAAYRIARENGARVLLTGEFGDHLYIDSSFWLRDLLLDRGIAAFLDNVRTELAARGMASLLRPGPLRSALSRALGWPGRRAAPPAWLTAEARARVAASRDAGRLERFPVPPRDLATPQPRILDPLCALASSLEHPTAVAAGVEIRRPYRDRRLIEFCLAIPAHLLQRPGSTKWLLRRAMRGILPEAVRERTHVSTLLPLTARGLLERESELVGRALSRTDASWRRFVDADWLAASFPSRLQAGLDGIESVVAWQCICSQLWFDRDLVGP